MEQQPSILGGARRLATSSTALLGIGAIVAIVVLAVYGRIDGQAATDFVKWIVIGYFTKVAVEDGAEKLGAGKLTDAVASAAALPTEKEES